ncbi:hypothetical protein Tco_1188990, partial [Tanacetum coccineum]
DVAKGLFLVQECAYQCLSVLRVLCSLNKDHETITVVYIINNGMLLS